MTLPTPPKPINGDEPIRRTTLHSGTYGPKKNGDPSWVAWKAAFVRVCPNLDVATLRPRSYSGFFTPCRRWHGFRQRLGQAPTKYGEDANYRRRAAVLRRAVDRLAEDRPMPARRVIFRAALRVVRRAAVARRAAVLRAVDLRAALLRAVLRRVAGLRAVVFRAALLRAVLRRAAGLRAVVFRAALLRAVVLRAVAFRAVVFRAALLRAVLRRAADLRAVVLRAVILRTEAFFVELLLRAVALVLRLVRLVAIDGLPVIGRLQP